MSKFIKLTNIILNTNDLHSIIVRPNKYYINFASNIFDGSCWCFSKCGVFSSNTYQIEVCKNTHPNDYKLVSDWIDKI